MAKNEISRSNEDWCTLRIMHPQGVVFESTEKETENGFFKPQRGCRKKANRQVKVKLRLGP